MDGGTRARVLIAGAGVAGLEAALALSRLAPELADVELLDPAEEFLYRPLLVAEPFGVESVIRFPLAKLAEQAGARLRSDSLAEVRAAEKVVVTAAGEKVEYDALLVTPGGRPVDAVPGAITFGGASTDGPFDEVLRRLGRPGWRRVAFVVPSAATWTIAAYELAFLTAAERRDRGLADAEIALVSHEHEPLGAFGPEASELVRRRAAEADVELHLGAVATGHSGETLSLAGGGVIEADRVVALPRLEVAEIPGLPHGPQGFLKTDVQMELTGLGGVWAAGDATAFPVKQGGLAAQQADVAARAIAVRAGARLPMEAYRPVLRAELITGGAPEFLRSHRGGGDADSSHSTEPLWWPPEKLAARYLGPLLAAESAGISFGELIDLDPPDDPVEADAQSVRAIELLLAAADSDARQGEWESALASLALAERLELVLPPEYVARRERWRRKLEPGSSPSPSPAAGRIDPTLIDATAALDDLEHRIGRMRARERDIGSRMRRDLTHLDEGLDQLRALSRETGVLPPERGRRSQ